MVQPNNAPPSQFMMQSSELTLIMQPFVEPDLENILQSSLEISVHSSLEYPSSSEPTNGVLLELRLIVSVMLADYGWVVVDFGNRGSVGGHCDEQVMLHGRKMDQSSVNLQSQTT